MRMEPYQITIAYEVDEKLFPNGRWKFSDDEHSIFVEDYQGWIVPRRRELVVAVEVLKRLHS